MAKLNHKQKVKMARKMMSRREMSIKGMGIFHTWAWNRHAENIKKRFVKEKSFSESLATL